MLTQKELHENFVGKNVCSASKQRINKYQYQSLEKMAMNSEDDLTATYPKIIIAIVRKLLSVQRASFNQLLRVFILFISSNNFFGPTLQADPPTILFFSYFSNKAFFSTQKNGYASTGINFAKF